MNPKQPLYCLLLSIFTFSPLAAAENPTNAKTIVAEHEKVMLTSDYSLDTPFNPEELRSLAEKPKRTKSDQRRLMLLILHASIEMDNIFQDLLTNKELRKDESVDLALSGYDYALNKSNVALDHILAQLATEDVGADAGAIVVLQILDEWDRSIRAYRKHFVFTDGAGGLCKRNFLVARAYLYPKKYQEMREIIEAPIKWSTPLIPVNYKGN